MAKKEEDEMTSSTTVLTVFMFVFATYYIIRFFLIDNYAVKDNSVLGIPITILAFAIVFLFQLTTNFKNTRILCGNVQFGSAAWYTALPFVLIIGTLVVAMTLFPGWKAPFSNTLGYGLVKIMGVETVFNNMLKTKAGNNKLLQKVYQDKSILINLMTPGPTGTFEKVIKQLAGEDTNPQQTGGAIMGQQQAVPNIEAGNGIFNPQYKDYIPQLYNFVLIKDYVSEFMWFILAGFLSIQTSFNQIIGIECKKTEEQLEKSMATFNTKQKQMMKKKKEAQKFKVFD